MAAAAIERKVLIADEHDMVVHGLPWALMPKQIIEYTRRRAKDCVPGIDPLDHRSYSTFCNDVDFGIAIDNVTEVILSVREQRALPFGWLDFIGLAHANVRFHSGELVSARAAIIAEKFRQREFVFN